MDNILISGCIVLPMTGGDGDKYFTGNIGISGGKIAFVSRDDKDAWDFRTRCDGPLRVIDGRGKLAMPGLVNTHNHISMTLMRGYADDLPLMRWLNEYIWPFESRLGYDDVRLGAELGIAEMLLGGVTTTSDMYWMEEAVAESVVKCGIRAVLSPTFTDLRFGDFEKDFEAVTSKYGAGQHPLITLMIAPHSAYTCSPENLVRARELSLEYGFPLNIHISETMDEQHIIRERYGKTPVEHLDSLGMLMPSTLAVHVVHVSDSDIEIMKERGVSVAHNPQSNMKLASGVAPVKKFVEAGLNISIGTDGPSSNNDLDMWDELRSASFLQKCAVSDPCILPAYEVLEMATVNGAKALGLGECTGKLAEGMLADVILLDIEQPHLYPRHDIVANLVYCAKSSDVDTVMVGGRTVVENKLLLTTDVKELCRSVQKRVGQITER